MEGRRQVVTLDIRDAVSVFILSGYVCPQGPQWRGARVREGKAEELWDDHRDQGQQGRDIMNI